MRGYNQTDLNRNNHHHRSRDLGGHKVLMRDSGYPLDHDQDLCSINSTTIRISPRMTFSPKTHAYIEIS